MNSTEEARYEQLRKLGQELHIPISETFWEPEVKNDELVRIALQGKPCVKSIRNINGFIIGYHLVQLYLIALTILNELIKAIYLDGFGALTIEVFILAFTALFLATSSTIRSVHLPELLSPVLGYLITGYPY